MFKVLPNGPRVTEDSPWTGSIVIPVLFRVDLTSQLVVAVFPTEPYGNDGDMEAYTADGSTHCSLAWYCRQTRAATEAEYTELKNKLDIRLRQEGYLLHIAQRMSVNMKQTFLRNVQDIHRHDRVNANV